MPWKNKEAEKAYKKKYYQENKEWIDKINIESRKKWMRENPEKARKQAKKEYDRNGLERQRVWQSKNRARLNELERIRVKRLDNIYLKKQLIKLGWCRNDLEKYPQLVLLYKEMLKIKRETR